MTSRITAGKHIKIRSDIRVHGAAIILIIREKLPPFKGFGLSCKDNRLRKKFQIIVT